MTLFHHILIYVKLSIMHWWHDQLSLILGTHPFQLPRVITNPQYIGVPVFSVIRVRFWVMRHNRSKRQYREHAAKCPTPKPWAPWPFIKAICPFCSWVIA